jgi:hypothetical protein
MSLIRVSTAINLNKWDSDQFDPTKIIKEWFDTARDPNPSVFCAQSEGDEVEVAASHSLMERGPGLKGSYLLRIKWSDLIAVGAKEQTTNINPGTTGVVHIDFRHWEMRSAMGYLNDLVLRIREHYEAGEQRFRWIGPPVLRRQLAEFASRSDNEVIQEAKRRCRNKLNAVAGTLPLPVSEDLRRQLYNARPSIPEQVIRERAFSLFERSRNHDANRNWMDAERELLTAYEQGIVEYSAPPTPRLPA